MNNKGKNSQFQSFLLIGFIILNEHIYSWQCYFLILGKFYYILDFLLYIN